MQPFAAAWYDEVVAPEYRLPRVRPDALALLIGNTRALWPRFVAALPELAGDPDPLERYIMRAVTAALADVRHEVRYAHEPPPRRIAIQRAAAVAGLAWLAPSHLSIHPVYGPWIGLDAIVVLDEAAPAERPAPPPPCPACDHACQPALARALAASDPANHRAVEAAWPVWLAIRDACPTGRAHRYSDEHIRYVHSKDRALLIKVQNVTPASR